MTWPSGFCKGRVFPGSGALCVSQLVRRLRRQEDFPHEVGLFLSYPPEDVAGFIANNARRCKCAGLWKVLRG